MCVCMCVYVHVCEHTCTCSDHSDVNLAQTMLDLGTSLVEMTALSCYLLLICVRVHHTMVPTTSVLLKVMIMETITTRVTKVMITSLTVQMEAMKAPIHVVKITNNYDLECCGMHMSVGYMTVIIVIVYH